MISIPQPSQKDLHFFFDLSVPALPGHGYPPLETLCRRLVLTGCDLAADLPGDVASAALEEKRARQFPGMVSTYEPQD